MKKLLITLAMLAALIFSFFPLILTSTYLFTGFDRQAMLDLLTKIPARNFWAFAVPMLIGSYAVTMLLFYKTLERSVYKKERQEPKQIYYLEDQDLGDKLSGVIISRPETVKTPLSFEEQYENAYQQ
jgi:hypothetical protein